MHVRRKFNVLSFIMDWVLRLITTTPVGVVDHKIILSDIRRGR
jgi:hypothetical protein